MQTETTSNKIETPLSPDGYLVGQSSSDKIAFYGASPVVQPSHASQAAVTAITDTSGGTGALDTGLQALTASYNSGIIANSLSTLALGVNNANTLVNCLRAELVSLGLIKGS